MNNELVEIVNSGSSNQGSAILKTKYHNPKDLIVQHLPFEGKVNKIEVNRLGNGFIIDTLSNVFFQEILKTGVKVVEIYERVIYRESFKISPFRKYNDKLFAMRQKYKDENDNVIQLLVKLIMNSLYGEQIRKDIEEKFARKSQSWMLTEYEEKVKVYCKIS